MFLSHFVRTIALRTAKRNSCLCCLHIIHGFPAQLLTYAACTTMDAYIRQLDIADPIAWADSILGWLESPAAIMLCHIQFAIPDVYQLYDAYLLGAKAQWEANNHLRYQSGIPQTRYFMTRLLEQTQIECNDAIRDLSIKRSIGYKDNIDNIPLESTLSSGSGLYFP